MASISTADNLSQTIPVETPNLSWRQLWQIPTLLLGLLTLSGVWLARPLWPPQADNGGRVLLDLRQAVMDRNLNQAVTLSEEALQCAEQNPHLAGEAHFLVGSLQVLLAEQTSAESPQQWQKARELLEQAQTQGVPEEDATLLMVRLGRAWAQTLGPGESPQRVIEALKVVEEETDPAAPEESKPKGRDETAPTSPPEGEGIVDRVTVRTDPIEMVRIYTTLAEAYLQLPKQDIEKALKAYQKAVQQPLDRDDLLAPVRLRLGELLLDSGESVEVRQQRVAAALEVLKNIGEKAPPALAARARLLRVRSLEENKLWEEAAEVWQEILKSKLPSPRDRLTYLYHLGLCQKNSKQAAEAAQSWTECLGTPLVAAEVPAAALGLGELRVNEQKWAEAYAALEKAVSDVKVPSEWRNELVNLQQVRDTFEMACQRSREGKEYDWAIRLARLYERVAPAGLAAELRGRAAEAGAWERKEQAHQANPVLSTRLQAERKALLIQAGEAYEQAAAAQVSPSREQLEHLWKSARYYAGGGEYPRTVETMSRFLEGVYKFEGQKVTIFRDRMGEGYYWLGEAHRALHHDKLAKEAYEKCTAGRFAYRARYELAVAAKERGEVDHAKDLFLQNLREPSEERDDEAKENTLFSLGFLYFEQAERGQQDKLRLAVDILERALNEFPNSVLAKDAHFALAVSYCLQADHLNENLKDPQLTPESRDRDTEIIAGKRTLAAKNFQRVIEILQPQPVRDPKDELRLILSSIRYAQCLSALGKFETAGQYCESLAERYQGRPERYNALAEMVRSYWAIRERSPEENLKIQRALAEIRENLNKLDPADRPAFEEWLKAFN